VPVEEEGSAPEDLTSWWPGGRNGGLPGLPANPFHLPRRTDAEPPPQAPPELGIPASRTPEPSDPPEWQTVRSEIRSLVRMCETVLDTLASQLRQDEQATRQFTEHLNDVDTQLERLSGQLESSVPDSAERESALAALDGYADAIRRLESGMQALFAELERMQRGQQVSQSSLTGRAIYVGSSDRTSHRILHVDLSTPGAVTLGTALCAGLGIAVRRRAIAPLVIAPVVGVGAALLRDFLRMPAADRVAARPFRLTRPDVLTSRSES